MARKDGPLMGSKVIVQQDNYEKALRTFKKKILESGKLIELKEKRHEMQSTVNKIDIETRSHKREKALFITRELIFERFGKDALEEIKGEVQRRMELKTLKDESSIS